MRIDELEGALRQMAASEPPVSPTARQDVVRRARRHRLRNSVGVLAVVAAVVGGIAFASVDRSPKTTHIGVRPGPTVPATTVPSGVSTTVPPTTAARREAHAVPAGFEAVSVTFVSPRTGWVLGSVPCASQFCIALGRTDDAGRSWRSVPAPPAKIYESGPDRSGVNEVRFANLNDGWVFGPALWATHDGGSHWSRVSLPGVPTNVYVAALEASAGRVHAVVLDDMQSFKWKIESSPTDRDQWQLSETAIDIGAGPVANTQLVLNGSAGWIVEVDRVVIGGARLEGGRWVPWQPPCTQSSGQALIAASTSSDLAAICDEGIWGGAPRGEHAYVSSDAGSTFQRAATPVPIQGSLQIATPVAGTIVIAADTGLVTSFDGGQTWHTDSQGANGAWKDLGFTDRQQGVVVAESGAVGPEKLFMTFDGGHNWKAVPIVG